MAQKTIVSLEDKSLKINTFTFETPWTVTQVQKALGNPDKTSNLANVLYTYDRGLVFYQTTQDSMITEIQIYHQLTENISFLPAKVFTGKFTVEGIKLKKKVSLKKLQRKYPQLYLQESYSSTVYEGKLGEFYLFINFSDDLQTVKYYSLGFGN